MRNKVAAALLVALFLAPVGLAATELDKKAIAVENHTTYVELIVEEERLREKAQFAAIAGVVACRPANPIGDAVLWFNDQVLFRAPGPPEPDIGCVIDNDTHVYAVEEGAPDPRGNPGLSPTGDTYEFTDPNGVRWLVQEYAYFEVVVDHLQETDVLLGPVRAALDVEVEARFIKHLAWVVRVGDNTLDPTIRDFYNFVVLLNLTKMDEVHGERETHDGSAGDVRRGNSHDASRADEAHRTPHVHDTAQIHLFTGGLRRRTRPRRTGKGFESPWGARRSPRRSAGKERAACTGKGMVARAMARRAGRAPKGRPRPSRRRRRARAAGREATWPVRGTRTSPR